ncbi:MAG: hypothetical protein OEY49_18715, partial [Candidatus Heimdallarchaeota archaeon]|nr:hypothetical protein [Candidatus Heimdallarchaeota archaeon]
TLSIENLAIYLFDLNSGPLSLSETLVGNKFDPRYNHIKYVNPGEYSILLLSYTHIMHDFSISLNSFNSSGDITFETSLIGQLDVDEEIKLYRYQIDTLNTGIKIIPNSEVNYQMMTFREDGFMLDFLQLNHLNSNTRYSFYNKTGSYFLVLIEIPYFGVANFDLTIEPFTIMHDLYEPDNDISTTNIITDGETQRHNILNNKYSHGNSHDFDVIGFNVNTFSLVSFNITASSFDIMVNLLDQNGNSIMHKKSTNFFGDKQIEFMALNNGHYYLQIYDSMYESYVDYNITMNVQSLSVDNYEPDDTQQTSTDLIQDETQTHYLDNSASTDQDWFKIVVGDSDQAQVNITIDRTFTYDYLDLELIDENGNSISLMSIELGDGSEMLYYAVVFGNQNYYLKVTSTYLVGVSGTGVFGLYTITYSSDVDSMVNNISSSSPSTSSSLNILFVPILLNLIIVHKVITKLNANKKN